MCRMSGLVEFSKAPQVILNARTCTNTFESETKQVNPTSLTLLSFRSFYLSRSPRSLQLPFTLPSTGALWSPPKSQNPAGRSEVYGQASEEVSPLFAALVHSGGRTDTKGKPRRQNLTSCFSTLRGARPPPACTPLRFGRSSQSKEEAGAPPWAAPRALTLPGGIPPAGAVRQVARQEEGAVAWLQLPPGHGTGTRRPPFPIPWLQLAPPARALRRAGRVLPLRATLGCAVPRRAPSSGLFPLLGEERGNRETERGPRLASGRLPACAALPGRGWSSGGCPGAPAARLGLGGAGVSARPGTRGSGAVRLGGPLLRHCGAPPLAAGKSGCHSHGGALPLGAEPAPPHTCVRAHTRNTPARAHTRECGGPRAEPAPLCGSGPSHW